MSETATFTYRLPGGTGRILIDEPELFLDAASDAAGVSVLDASGKVVGTFRAAMDDLDEAPGLTDEDREDLRDAIAAKREEGFIRWEDIKAEMEAMRAEMATPEAHAETIRARDRIEAEYPPERACTTSDDVWDDATGTPEEDAEDIRLANLAMEDIRLHGTIPWEQVKAELGIQDVHRPNLHA